MRLTGFRLLVLLISWCVGIQSTAMAMGARCAHGQMPQGHEHAEMMSGGMHHAGMMRSTQEASPDLHQHHQVNASATQAALSAEVGLMDGCQCGCNCESIGCVIGGLGIARAISNHCYVPAAEPFSRKAPKLDQRAAHNLELIRPPSKS